MERASVTSAKNQLSAWLERVRAGERVLILDRDVPVAVLGPVDWDPGAEPVADLARRGVIEAGQKALPQQWLEQARPRPKGSRAALDALLEERREGR
jgi:antitoxin (DNA-binding transcriptional repressor) of toxin-antitoxin stability system